MRPLAGQGFDRWKARRWPELRFEGVALECDALGLDQETLGARGAAER
ncbi:MAG: hypothetical protein K2X35_05435 [Bryobacteraceae bacterium]|nr:hypothetical protein [Bryobacteraceae bacterium]